MARSYNLRKPFATSYSNTKAFARRNFCVIFLRDVNGQKWCLHKLCKKRYSQNMHFKLQAENLRLFAYFFLLIFVGTLALMHPAIYHNAKSAPLVDCIFTAVSAVCVTGLSTVDMTRYSALGFVLICALIELGGLGIITFISLLYARPTNKISLVNRKIVRNYFLDSVDGNPKRILWTIFSATISIQIIGALLLYVAFCTTNTPAMAHPFGTALFLSVSAFCNAGFSPFADSLASFKTNYAVQIIIMLLIVFGGLGFSVFKDLWQSAKSKQRRMRLHSKIVLVMTIFLIISGSIFFYIIEENTAFAGLTLPQKIFAAIFQSITLRTAGFETVAQGNFSLSSSLISIVFMFIGGSPGSIAGGVKTTTFFLVLMYAIRGNEEKIRLNVMNRRVPSAITSKALSIVAKSIFILFVSVFVLTITERASLANNNFTFLDIFFEAASAFGTVGLSRGISSELSLMGKIVIICTMFIGRTGIFAMVLHQEKRIARLVEYPEETIMIG